MSHATLHKATRPEVQKSVDYFVSTVQSQGVDEELLISFLRESAESFKKRQPHGGALSDEQVAFLIESGDFTAQEFAEIEASVARGDLAEEERKTRLGAVTDSLSAAAVALQLGIDTSRVRHRQAKGGLYAFIAGSKRRYPTWQFTGDPAQPVLPGLATLVNGFPVGMHPASIRGFMMSTQTDLRVNQSSRDSECMTPVEWLRQGGDPQAVVDILNSILQS